MGGQTGIDLFILERVDYGMTPKCYTDFQVTIRDFCTANRLVKGLDIIEAIDDPAIIIMALNGKVSECQRVSYKNTTQPIG